MTLATRLDDMRLTEPVAGIHRVELGTTTLGYVLEAGAVFVTLRGPVYNTSCEVGQSLDLDTAVALLLDR